MENSDTPAPDDEKPRRSVCERPIIKWKHEFDWKNRKFHRTCYHRRNEKLLIQIWLKNIRGETT